MSSFSIGANGFASLDLYPAIVRILYANRHSVALRLYNNLLTVNVFSLFRPKHGFRLLYHSILPREYLTLSILERPRSLVGGLLSPRCNQQQT